jgi:site-specific DNA recombinase
MVLEKPELRIVSNELFEQARAHRNLVNKGGRKREGGMSRTDTARKYIFSGLLRCGLCGSNMTIICNNPSRYGCPLYRSRGTCSNWMTIRQDLLETGLIEGLGHNLNVPELRETIVSGMLYQLDAMQLETTSKSEAIVARRVQYEEERTKLRKTIANICDAIENDEGSRALNDRLRAAEGRLEQLDQNLSGNPKPAMVKFSRNEIERFVEQQSQRFGQILKSDPVTAKHELRKRISEIVLTPSEDSNGPIYIASGDVALFNTDNVVLQQDSFERTRLQYNFPLKFSLVPYITKRSRTMPKAIRTKSDMEQAIRKAS